MAPTRRLVRPAVDALEPYRPGKPVEEARRELGLERIVKLASNEGPYPPFAAALEAIRRSAAALNRYPDGGVYRLQLALAERHGVDPGQVCAGSGADGCLDVLSQALLDPGDEVVCGWPSFPSYPIYAAKQGATVRRVALRDGRHDLEALAAAVGERTKILYVCQPNNPTGTANGAEEIDSLLEQVGEGVLTVIDQAYFEYVSEDGYEDAVARYVLPGRNVLVLRTFSKIYGLAGLRVGYAVGPAEVCAAMAKLRRPFDLSTLAQEAALASLGDDEEVARRREANRSGRETLVETLHRHQLEPLGGAVANFVYVETHAPAEELAGALLQEGVIVRPLGGFGAPSAVRISVGTAEELALLDAALDRLEVREARRSRRAGLP